MDTPIITKKLFYFVIILTLLFCIYSFGYNYFHSGTKIAVCHSTNGVIIYLRVKNRVDVVLYPDTTKIQNTLACLGKNMPFYDKHIEFLFSSSSFIYSKQFSELTKYYNINSFISNILPQKNINNLNIIEIKKELTLKIKSDELHVTEDKVGNQITYSQQNYKVIILENSKQVSTINQNANNKIDVIIVKKLNNSAILLNILSSIKPKNVVINDSLYYKKGRVQLKDINIIGINEGNTTETIPMSLVK